jgi:TDG/mug DNA glycosylase family protein
MAHAEAPLGLPDLLAPGLKAIFCGLNPGMQAATSGHHFVGRQNRFWAVMHLAGFTPTLIDALDDRSFLGCGYGLTTAVARATVSAAEVARDEYASAGDTLARKIERFRPRAVGFLGKAAYAAIAGQSVVDWGKQAETFGGSVAWILPNPSGLNRGFSLDALAEHYSQLRKSLG